MATAVQQPAANVAPPTVGDAIARFLEAQNIDAAFGVISIHNMPILDAFGRRDKIRFVPSRGEAGCVNMADACARVSGRLSVAVTSTGTGAGNAAGALIEAYTAGSPVLHLTGQIESEFLDRDLGFIHEAPAQLAMMKSVSKAAYRVSRPDELMDILHKATTQALTAPKGPVSIEIPVDVQKATLHLDEPVQAVTPVVAHVTSSDVDRVVAALAKARRPMIMLGGGARHASVAATQLADRGIGIVTSTNGRAIVAEDHPMSLGAFNLNKHVEALYQDVDLMLVVGSRLRSNETWSYKLTLPQNRIRVDCDPATASKAYPDAEFVLGDSDAFLTELAGRLPEELDVDPRFAAALARAKRKAIDDLRGDLGPYAELVDELQRVMPRDAVWVRDVTLSNSMWGNRMLQLAAPNKGVHALGGGIGQGVPMALGAACAADGAKTILLTGDGGLSLCMGELVAAAEQNADVTMILMNDQGYGVIRNIQDAIYGGRQYYSSIFTPKFAAVAEAINVPHVISDSIDKFATDIKRSLARTGFSIVEVDMIAVGPFGRAFAGPPLKN